MSLFCRKLVEITPKKRPFLWSFGYWASIFNLKNKDRFEHEIVLKILTKSEPRCSYKIVLIKKKECINLKCFSKMLMCFFQLKYCVTVEEEVMWKLLARDHRCTNSDQK